MCNLEQDTFTYLTPEGKRRLVEAEQVTIDNAELIHSQIRYGLCKKWDQQWLPNGRPQLQASSRPEAQATAAAALGGTANSWIFTPTPRATGSKSSTGK